MYIHMVSTKNIFKAIWISSVIVFTEDFGKVSFLIEYENLLSWIKKNGRVSEEFYSETCYVNIILSKYLTIRRSLCLD